MQVGKTESQKTNNRAAWINPKLANHEKREAQDEEQQARLSDSLGKRHPAASHAGDWRLRGKRTEPGVGRYTKTERQER